MKIKFLAFNYTAPFSFNPVYYWLKSFYKTVGKNYEKYEWLETEHVFKEELSEKIKREAPDILCVSLYLWNIKSSMKIAKQAKIDNPNIIIICGGPECHANTDDDWFEIYPFVDYATYGDGERAFSGLLDYFYDGVDFDDIPNVVTKDAKNKHEIFKFSSYPSYSPYLDLEEEFIEDYLGLKASIGGKPVYLPYENARGCMYKCSFCDWHGGIHHKVNRRIADYKSEIDFFSKHGIRAFQTDANVGIYQEDVDLYKYVKQKALENGTDKMIPVEPRNMAKLNKDRVSEIWNILCSIDSKPKFQIKAAIQTIYEESLKKIDRPDIPWHQHKKILSDIRINHPHSEIGVELILGLPEMSNNKIYDMFLEFSDISVDYVYSYEWMLLKKSPAYSKIYRDKIGLDATQTLYPSVFSGIESDNIKIADFYKDPQILVDNNQAYFIDIAYDKEHGIDSVVYQKILTRAYNKLARLPEFDRTYWERYINKHNMKFLNIAQKEAEAQKLNLQKYGFFFWGVFDYDNGLIKTHDFLFDDHIMDS